MCLTKVKIWIKSNIIFTNNCHRWSIIGRCWYNDHRSWKRYRFPSLFIIQNSIRGEAKGNIMLSVICIDKTMMWYLWRETMLCLRKIIIYRDDNFPVISRCAIFLMKYLEIKYENTIIGDNCLLNVFTDYN
jgi:hypothetical protein